MDNTIFLAVGFKSYAITRAAETSRVWFDWTERGKDFIRRTSFGLQTMEWISQVMLEASKVQGNIVRRWKKNDTLSETFVSRNYNKFGRYISIVSLRGRGRSVLIIPEMAFNVGWKDIADKVGRFINRYATQPTTFTQRLTE